MHTIREIALALDGRAEGNDSLRISHACEPALAGQTDLAVALAPGFVSQLGGSLAKAVLLVEGAEWDSGKFEAAVFVPRARLGMARMTQLLDTPPAGANSIHPTAVIDADAQVSEGVTIGPLVSIDAGARIGAGSMLFAGCRIGRNVKIGRNCIIQSNVVIGGDGFSYVTSEPAHVELARKTMGEAAAPVLADPSWHRIHSLGSVVLGDNVEIGANSCVDAGTLRPTSVGNGTKIDSLVQVGHNAVIGAHCLLCAQAGVAGSAVIGDRTVVGGKAGVADNITIGADVVLGGGSVVLSNVPDGRVMLGYPATRMATHIESYKALRRLPRILARLRGTQ